MCTTTSRTIEVTDQVIGGTLATVGIRDTIQPKGVALDIFPGSRRRVTLQAQEARDLGAALIRLAEVLEDDGA